MGVLTETGGATARGNRDLASRFGPADRRAAYGKVSVTPPVVTCRRCLGSGREGGDLSCLACRGTGVVSVRKGATPCPKCGGTGEDGVFYCTACKGQGIA